MPVLPFVVCAYRRADIWHPLGVVVGIVVAGLVRRVVLVLLHVVVRYRFRVV